MTRIKVPKGLNGPTGLISSVIACAVKDAMRGTKADQDSALRYLRSDVYQSHLSMLSLPVDWLPVDRD